MQKLANEPTLANGLPHSKSRIDALNSATSNLAHKPILADGPPVLTSSGPEWQFHIATNI